MNALAVAVAGPCPASTDQRRHSWEQGDSAYLVSVGAPGVSVYLGRYRYCAVPLLTVVPLSQDPRGAGPFLEAPGAKL